MTSQFPPSRTRGADPSSRYQFHEPRSPDRRKFADGDPRAVRDRWCRRFFFVRPEAGPRFLWPHPGKNRGNVPRTQNASHRGKKKPEAARGSSLSRGSAVLLAVVPVPCLLELDPERPCRRRGKVNIDTTYAPLGRGRAPKRNQGVPGVSVVHGSAAFSSARPAVSADPGRDGSWTASLAGSGPWTTTVALCRGDGDSRRPR